MVGLIRLVMGTRHKNRGYTKSSSWLKHHLIVIDLIFLLLLFSYLFNDVFLVILTSFMRSSSQFVKSYDWLVLGKLYLEGNYQNQ